jgi:hypothetical protein
MGESLRWGRNQGAVQFPNSLGGAKIIPKAGQLQSGDDTAGGQGGPEAVHQGAETPVGQEIQQGGVQGGQAGVGAPGAGIQAGVTLEAAYYPPFVHGHGG